MARKTEFSRSERRLLRTLFIVRTKLENRKYLVISPWNGYGPKTSDPLKPFECKWTGGAATKPHQDNWGYTHSLLTQNDHMGFRIVYVPSK